MQAINDCSLVIDPMHSMEAIASRAPAAYGGSMRSTNRTSTEGSNRWREDARASQCQRKNELRTIPTPAQVLVWVAMTCTLKLNRMSLVSFVHSGISMAFHPAGHQRPSGIYIYIWIIWSSREKGKQHFPCTDLPTSYVPEMMLHSAFLLLHRTQREGKLFRSNSMDDVSADPAGTNIVKL